MRHDLFEMQYFETYYVANMVTNLVNNAFTEADFLGLTGQFFGGCPEAFSPAFPRQSALHNYIQWVINLYSTDDLDGDEVNRVLRGEHVLWVDLALRHYNFEESFYEYLGRIGKTLVTAVPDDISDYHEELLLRGPYEELLEKIAGEVFFILFLNREFLGNFNKLISKYLTDVAIEDIDEELRENFEQDGVLRRKNMPKWVRKAVFHRDRGRCSICHTDLTGLISISSKENFDHIIPLAKGGVNDITNIQLLCEACNKSKSHKTVPPSKFYEKWYNMK